MPRQAYRAFIPDLSYYQETVACQNACPVRTDARAYVNAIAQGEDERAYLIARETNPFASTCGWVCGAPCEAACRRGEIDAPVAIRALKRFVNDRYGVYLGDEAETRQAPAWPAYGGSSEGFDLGNTHIPNSRRSLGQRGEVVPNERGRVAIVGAGPAGLSCAHDLALLGHQVVIFEASQVAGGMLRMGIPEYRLPRELIDLEIEAVLALGPEIRYGQALGPDFELRDLRTEFDAVFLALGTYKSRKLNVEGEEQDGVLRAVDFLLNVNLGGYNLDLGRKVIVVGGGNVAMDVARTAARLGQPTEAGGDLELALDVARAARRLGTTQEVHCLVVEDRDEMLADPEEIAEAEAEGIELHNHVAPIRIVGDGEQARAVRTLAVERAFDDQGRFNPKLIPETERDWDCDSVIVAIGQVGDLEWVSPDDGLETMGRGTLVVDENNLMTTAAGVFAGGDIAFGPRLIINAVADGQKAAAGIDVFLRGARSRRKRVGYFTRVDRKQYDIHRPARRALRWRRQGPKNLPVDRRIGVTLVEVGYEEKQARQQAKRCLICSLNPVFDSSLCILCNGCVDVCPTDCIKLVPMSEVDGGHQIATLVPDSRREEVTAILFDPAQCIRCGLCADRCPTEAVVMHAFRFGEERVFEEAVE